MEEENHTETYFQSVTGLQQWYQQAFRTIFPENFSKFENNCNQLSFLSELWSFPQGYLQTKQWEWPFCDSLGGRHKGTGHLPVTEEKQGGEGEEGRRMPWDSQVQEGEKFLVSSCVLNTRPRSS